MSQSKQLPTHILIHIVEQLNVPLKSLVATITLLDGGGTVRFLRLRSADLGRRGGRAWLTCPRSAMTNLAISKASRPALGLITRHEINWTIAPSGTAPVNGLPPSLGACASGCLI